MSIYKLFLLLRRIVSDRAIAPIYLERTATLAAMVRLLAHRIVDANGERRTGRREQASVFVVGERRMIAKDLGGRFGEVIQVDAQVALVLTETLRRSVRQARQVAEEKVVLMLAETLRCRV